MIPKFTRWSLLGFIIVAQLAAAADWLILYRSGDEKLRRGMGEEASHDLRKALRGAESENASRAQLGAILDALGRSRFRLGKYREAITYFERAIRLADQPAGRVPGLANSAQAYRELHEYRKSETCVREALDIDANDARIWQLLGSVLIQSRKFEEAKAAERRALELGDSFIAALVWSDLSVMEEAQGRVGEAAANLRRAIGIFPRGQQRARLLVNLAVLEQKTKRGHEAATHLLEATQEMESAVGKTHPDLAKALESYAEVLRRMGRKPEARQAAQRAREIRHFLATTVDWHDLKTPAQ